MLTIGNFTRLADEEGVMRTTLLMGAALIYIFGATEISASIIHVDFSGRAESVRFVCSSGAGCGPNVNISSNFTPNLSFDSGPEDLGVR